MKFQAQSIITILKLLLNTQNGLDAIYENKEKYNPSKKQKNIDLVTKNLIRK